MDHRNSHDFFVVFFLSLSLDFNFLDIGYLHKCWSNIRLFFWFKEFYFRYFDYFCNDFLRFILNFNWFDIGYLDELYRSLFRVVFNVNDLNFWNSDHFLPDLLLFFFNSYRFDIGNFDKFCILGKLFKFNWLHNWNMYNFFIF